MEELIKKIAATTGLAPDATGQAITQIFAFLRKEGPKEDVDALLAQIPGALEAAIAKEGSGSKGGLFGGIMNMMGGGIMALAAQLMSLGLSMSDLQTLGNALFHDLRERFGEEELNRISAAIPGLDQVL
ncbi:hypothetical protein [Beijerinckia mobilis]|uniref:hypothetical protein n=1 Tax=Beijerinckia mobilis TaxID=231434 RepID=UPI00055220F6|nr:hypothetical protein [Beijerinckia mobilis]